MVIARSSYCTGCCACGDVCRFGAITMVYDDEGFLVPGINTSKCVKCNQCVNVCPANSFTSKNDNIISSYACWSNDTESRISSSSGGIFSVLASWIFQNNGVVYGAAFDESFHVKHGRAENMNELELLKKSKYIQSEMISVYPMIKKDCEQGKLVLFVGTPCQVSALYNYLGYDYEKLYTCDLICHGVGSTGYFVDCLGYLQKNFKSKVTEVVFREKSKGYNKPHLIIRFENGRMYKQFLYYSIFGHSFTKSFSVRKSCIECKYATVPRFGNFTLGDYSGKVYVNFNFNEIKRGISTLLINNMKAQLVFEEISDKIFAKKVDVDYIITTSNRLKGISLKTLEERDEFFAEYKSLDVKEIIQKYDMPSREEIRNFKYSGKWNGSVLQLIHKIVYRVKRHIS